MDAQELHIEGEPLGTVVLTHDHLKTHDPGFICSYNELIIGRQPHQRGTVVGIVMGGKGVLGGYVVEHDGGGLAAYLASELEKVEDGVVRAPGIEVDTIAIQKVILEAAVNRLTVKDLREVADLETHNPYMAPELIVEYQRRMLVRFLTRPA